MLKIDNLQKAYGKYQAINGLNMYVPECAIYGFVGPNGAGKTTTIKIITGLLFPDVGTVMIEGIDAVKTPRKLKERIGYVPDEFGTYDNLKVSEYMEFFAACYGQSGLTIRKRNEKLLGQVGLGDKADFYVDSLSRGMKQRLCLARALIHNPSMLVLDEPTSGLDPRTRLEYREMLKELSDQGKTIIISSHLLAELSELCSHIGIVDQGKMILEGSMLAITKKINETKPVVITVESGLEEAINLLKEHPQIKNIAVKGNEIVAGFTGDGVAESELLTGLVYHQVKIRGFVREAGSLETIFMQSTKNDKERVVLSYDHTESDL